MGSIPSQPIRMSADQLRTDIKIDCRVKVKGIDEALNRGTVHWLGFYYGEPIVVVRMDQPSEIYFNEIDTKFKNICFENIHRDILYISILENVEIVPTFVAPDANEGSSYDTISFPGAIRKNPQQLQTSTGIGTYAKVEGLPKGVNYGHVIWLGEYNYEPFVGLQMDESNDVYHHKMDKSLRQHLMKWSYSNDIYFVKLKLVTNAIQEVQTSGDDEPSTSNADDPDHDNNVESTETETSGVPNRDAQASSDDEPPASDGDDAGAASLGDPDKGAAAEDEIGQDMLAAMKKEIKFLRKGVELVNIHLSNLKGDLHKKFHKTRTERENQQIENEGVRAEVNKIRQLFKQEQVRRKDLETQHRALQTKHKASEEKLFVMAMVIFMMVMSTTISFIVWGTKCTTLDGTVTGEVKTDDTKSQSFVVTDELYKMSVQKQLITFDSTMSNIQSNFPDEGGRFWSAVFAPVRRLIQEKDPSRPAIVLIATTKSYSYIAECLSRKVASLVETVHGLNDNDDTYMTIEAGHLNSLDPDEAKSQMDQDLSDNYQGRHMVAVIHDLGSLPAIAATLLHAYCDHESARFKKAVLLATIYLEAGITLCTEEVEAYLAEVWQEVTEDVLKPLISRIANNIAIMETRDIANYVCQN